MRGKWKVQQIPELALPARLHVHECVRGRARSGVLIHSSWLLSLAVLHASHFTSSPFSSLPNPGNSALQTHPNHWTVFKGLHGCMSNEDTCVRTLATQALPHTDLKIHTSVWIFSETFRGQQSFTRPICASQFRQCFSVGLAKQALANPLLF